MRQADAISLIARGITGSQPQTWAELGGGSGTFTLALKSLLPAGSVLTAVDKLPQSLPVNFIQADFEKEELSLSGLDGILMANSLHYIMEKTTLINKLEAYFSATPIFLIVEYDSTFSNPWVPYPISFANLQKLFASLGYQGIIKLATKRSKFGGMLYAALLTKLPSQSAG